MTLENYVKNDQQLIVFDGFSQIFLKIQILRKISVWSHRSKLIFDGFLLFISSKYMYHLGFCISLFHIIVFISSFHIIVSHHRFISWGRNQRLCGTQMRRRRAIWLRLVARHKSEPVTLE